MSERRRLKNIVTSSQYNECHGIIHAASAACAGVGTGLAQIPLSDTAVITPIQVGMIIALGKVFDLEITESMAKASLASATIAVMGRVISQVLIGWLPGVGNIINASTAAALTEAVGWAMAGDFAKQAASKT